MRDRQCQWPCIALNLDVPSMVELCRLARRASSLVHLVLEELGPEEEVAGKCKVKVVSETNLLKELSSLDWLTANEIINFT